jgi:hypothetical protein
MTTKERVEISDKIMTGFKLAIKRLVEKTKKEGGYLVISRNGKVEKVPAKDL